MQFSKDGKFGFAACSRARSLYSGLLLRKVARIEKFSHKCIGIIALRALNTPFFVDSVSSFSTWNVSVLINAIDISNSRFSFLRLGSVRCFALALLPLEQPITAVNGKTDNNL